MDPTGRTGLVTASVKAGEDAASIVVAGSTVTAVGASRPHSHFEESRDGSGGASADVSAQHEWFSDTCFTACFMWQLSPSPHRPHGPAMGAAVTSPGRSSATTAIVRSENSLVILSN